MSLDCISIVLHGLNQFTLLDVHSFHPETQLFFLKLIIHDFLQAHSLKAKHIDKTVIVAFVGKDMIAIHSAVVDGKLMEDHITWSAHL